MAGAGYRLFNTGDVLTAAQVNTYLMEQTVMVFANATARTSALSGILAEGMVSYLQDTNALEVYNGSAWVAAGSSGDITAVTAGTGISGGGTSGDVTITNSMATAIDAKGDLIVGTGADTFSRLAVGGTNGHVLTVDSGESTGMKWAAASGGGDFVKIAAATFTNQASVTVDNCFSSSYPTYIVQILAWDAAGGGSDNDLQIQFRYSSSTQASDYYGSYFQYNRSNTLATGGYSNTAQMMACQDLGASTSPTSVQLTFNQVGNTSEKANFFGTGINPNNEQAGLVCTGWVNVARTYTGILIKSSANNISGNYAVWGLKR